MEMLLLASRPALVQCPTGDLTFTTQNQIDDFGTMYPDFTDFPGIISIQYDNYGVDNFTNLDGLAGLTSVAALVIISNAALTNVDGLAGLTSVGVTCIAPTTMH